MRAAGLLLHPTSLPGPEGIGTLGPEARGFVDFLAASGLAWWQMLPVTPPGPHASPYMARSAMAGAELLIDGRSLVEQGLVGPEALAPLRALPTGAVDYGGLAEPKRALLRAAYEQFSSKATAAIRQRFEQFCAAQAHWLKDYSLFEALSASHDGRSWTEWPAALKRRDAAELERATRELTSEICAIQFSQYLFALQWSSLKAYAEKRGVKLFGDAPIFVAHDSADVWCRQDLFYLDEAGAPSVVAGVPPDYFSETGQLWGNPLYRWERLAAEGYGWWISRMRRGLELFHQIRIDHFRGFAQYWEIPAGAATAVAGKWVDGPGEALFAALREAIGGLPFLAEDLGVITPDVEALRDGLGLAGMAILQFAFGGDMANTHLPHNFPHSRRAIYTGTHDNDTTAGWYEALSPSVRHQVRMYLQSADADVPAAMVRAAFASTAELAIIPVQDVLELGSQARMNTPGESEGNWGWRLRLGQLRPEHARHLHGLAAMFNRLAKAT